MTVNAIANKLIGRGAYKLRKNGLMTDSTQMPTMKRGNDFIEVDIHEFICNVVAPGNVNWNIQESFDINVGLATSFPMTAQFAMNAEEYELVQLLAVYVPTSGDITSTQGLGSVQFATQYDMADNAFGTEQEMLDYEYATVAKPSETMFHPIECDPRNNQLARFYSRNGLLPNTTSTQDPRYNAWDLGRLTIAVSGCSASAGVGLGKFFWVGKVRLYKPKLYQAIGLDIVKDSFDNQTWTMSGNIINSFGSAALTSNSTIGGSLSSNGTYVFPSRFQNSTNTFVFHLYTTCPVATTAYNQALTVVTNCKVLWAQSPVAGGSSISQVPMTIWIQLLGTGVPSVNFAPSISLTSTPTNGGGQFMVQESYPFGTTTFP
jgi:hypothetical protein